MYVCTGGKRGTTPTYLRPRTACPEDLVEEGKTTYLPGILRVGLSLGKVKVMIKKKERKIPVLSLEPTTGGQNQTDQYQPNAALPLVYHARKKLACGLLRGTIVNTTEYCYYGGP